MGSPAGHHPPRASRVRRGAAVALLLTLAGAGCQTGPRAAGTGGVSTPASAPTVPASPRTVPVQAPAGGRTYAAFCGAGAGCPTGGVPSALRRPIHLPHIPAGTRCPVSAPGRKVYRNQGKAIGPGPVYVLSFGSFGRTAILPFVLPSRAGLFGGSAWGGQVLKFIGAPSYHGPVLIRGRKLTEPSGLGFGAGKIPLAEMDVPGGAAGGVGLNPGGWRLWSGYARLRSPGCYGLQVDGTTFSEIIIFRACLSSNSVRQTFRCGRRDRR